MEPNRNNTSDLVGVRLGDLPEGHRFQWTAQGKFYIARGNGWYSSETGYDGGPWCKGAHATVFITRS